MWLKQWLVGLLGMTMLWSMAPLSSTSRQVPSTSAITVSTPQVIRFRVIANSDNPVDQAIKLQVRDRILETLDPYLNGVKNRSVAAKRIEELKQRLDRVANGVLARHHVSYRARVEWTRTIFPTKAYGSWVLPAGRYQALLIVLGKGEGHNWWCVLFPSLCFIDMGNALAVPTPIEPATPLSATPVRSRDSREHSQKKSTGTIHVTWKSPQLLREVLTILHE